MARFRVEFSTEAVRVLEGLDRSSSSRLIKKIESTLDNPLHYVERLSGRTELKLRTGDYRAILDLDEKRKVLFVRSIGHRRSIYSKR